jgi:hypothetical protein
MSVLMPFILSLEEEVELNQKPQDQEHNQLSELLQEMVLELEELKTLLHNQLIPPEETVVEEEEDSDLIM